MGITVPNVRHPKESMWDNSNVGLSPLPSHIKQNRVERTLPNAIRKEKNAIFYSHYTTEGTLAKKIGGAGSWKGGGNRGDRSYFLLSLLPTRVS